MLFMTSKIYVTLNVSAGPMKSDGDGRGRIMPKRKPLEVTLETKDLLIISIILAVAWLNAIAAAFALLLLVISSIDDRKTKEAAEEDE